MMKNKAKPLLVILDKNIHHILLSSRRKTYHEGFLSAVGGEDFDAEKDEVAAILNEMNIHLEDVDMVHLMDVTHYLEEEESVKLYVLRLNGVDPALERKHLFWIPIQHLSVCGGLLIGSGFEYLLIEYAVALVVNGKIHW